MVWHRHFLFFLEGEDNDGFSLRHCALPLALAEEVCMWLSRVRPCGESLLHHHGKLGLQQGGSWVSLGSRVTAVASVVRCCPAVSKARLGRGKPAVMGWPVPLHGWAGGLCRRGTGRESLSLTSLSTYCGWRIWEGGETREMAVRSALNQLPFKAEWNHMKQNLKNPNKKHVKCIHASFVCMWSLGWKLGLMCKWTC